MADDTATALSPESAPSVLAIDEPAMARMFGMIGFGAVIVGGLAVVFNQWGPKLIGPALGTALVLVGLAAMLYHAARDSDPLIRRAYQLFAIAAILAGTVLSVVAQPGMGDLFFPWGGVTLVLGLVFLLSASSSEEVGKWGTLAVGIPLLVGAAAAGIGFVGMDRYPELLPRFAGVAIVGLIFLWAAIGKIGAGSERGFRLGWFMGAIGAVAMLVAVGKTIIVSEPYLVPRGLAIGVLGCAFFLFAYGMCADRAVVAMTRRELAAYFYSPVAYLVLMGMAFVAWITYFQFVSKLLMARGQPIPEPIVGGYIIAILPVFAIMFAVPAVTMRLFSEEHRSGTIEVLLTAPVNEWSVVLSKFFAALVYFMLLLAPFGLFLIPVYNESPRGFDYLPLFSFAVALAASGAAFLSMGIFFSSLTRNQIVAAALTFAGMVAYLSLALLQQSQLTGAVRTVIEQFSFINVWFEAMQGKLHLHKVVTYLSVTAFWLFLTTKVLEARKWK